MVKNTVVLFGDAWNARQEKQMKKKLKRQRKKKKKKKEKASRGGGKAEAEKETEEEQQNNGDNAWPSIKISCTDFHSKCLAFKEKQVNMKE